MYRFSSDIECSQPQFLSPDKKIMTLQKSEELQEMKNITIPSSFVLQISPKNFDKTSALSYREKLVKYRQFKRPCSGTASLLATCRDRLSEVGKVK
jgi:hypothetical protein